MEKGYGRSSEDGCILSLLSWLLLAIFPTYGSIRMDECALMGLFAAYVAEKIWSKAVLDCKNYWCMFITTHIILGWDNIVTI